MHQSDQTMLVIGDDRRIELLVEDDAYRVKVFSLDVRAMLVDACSNTGGLPNIGG